MCFGTIVAKMWRVHFIFNHPQVQVTKQRQRVIKNCCIIANGIPKMYSFAVMLLLTLGTKRLAPDDDCDRNVLSRGDLLHSNSSVCRL